MDRMERMIAINNVRCVQFRPKVPSDRYFITYVNGDDCSAYVSTFNISASWTRERAFAHLISIYILSLVKTRGSISNVRSH